MYTTTDGVLLITVSASSTSIKKLLLIDCAIASTDATTLGFNRSDSNQPMTFADKTVAEIAEELDKARQRITNSAGLRIAKRLQHQWAKAIIKSSHRPAARRHRQQNWGDNDKFGFKPMKASYVY